MIEQDMREIVADILRGVGRRRWRDHRGHVLEPHELRDLSNLRRGEFALRWIVKREQEQAFYGEMARLREEIERADARAYAAEELADERRRKIAALEAELAKLKKKGEQS